MKRKRVYQVGYWVLLIIMVLVGSCQVEPDMSEYSLITEDETEEVADDITDDIIDLIEDPVIETPEPIEEITTMEYINNIDYHFPELLKDKSIRLKESDTVYKFSHIGIDLPTTMMLYPNPVNAWVFINAVEGQTTESVEIVTTDDGLGNNDSVTETGFSYAIHMTGKFEYKGNLYYGEVKIIVVYLNGVLTLNGLGAEFVE